MSLAADEWEQVLHCFVAYAQILQSFLSKNTRHAPPSLAAARVTRTARRHSGAMASVTHAARVTHCDPSHSPGRGAARRHSQRPARLTGPCPGQGN